MPRRMLSQALLFAALVAAACGSDSPATGAESEGSLVVYSGRSESLVGPIIEQFEGASGIDVSVKYGSTPEIAATILEEGKNTPADIFFAQDPGGLGALAHTMVPLPEDILQLVPSWARSPESRWVGLSGRARTVVYNRERLSEADLPSSIWDFTDPKWKGRLGWAPTNASFQTMVASMQVLWGEQRTREWLNGIKANEPQMYPKNTPIVAAAASGEIEVGFVNHYYLHRFIQEAGEDFGARNYYMADRGPGSLMMVAGAGILESAKNSASAESFLRFMLSKVAQQYFAGQTFEYPLVEGVNTHRLLVPLSELNNPDIDMASLGSVKGTQSLIRELGIIP